MSILKSYCSPVHLLRAIVLRFPDIVLEITQVVACYLAFVAALYVVSLVL